MSEIDNFSCDLTNFLGDHGNSAVDNFLGELRKAQLTTINPEAELKIGYGIVEARCSLDRLQWVFLFALIAAMDNTRETMGFYKVSATEIANILKINGKNRIRVIRELCGTLLTAKVYLRTIDKNGEITEDEMTWFHRLRSQTNNPYILFKMENDLASLLLQQEKYYVKLKLSEIIEFRCKYSFQIYALAVKNKRFKKQTFLIANLVEQFECPQAYRFSSLFENRVVKPAVEEINKNTNLKINYKIANKSKLILTILQKDKYVDFFESLSLPAQNAYNYFKDEVKVASHAMVTCVNKYGEEIMIKICNEIKVKDPKGVKNMAAYAAACLLEGYYKDEHEELQKLQKEEIEKQADSFNEKLQEEFSGGLEDSKQKCEAEIRKIEREKLLKDIKRMSNEEQRFLFDSIMNFLKKEMPVQYSVLKKFNYQTIYENQVITNCYLNAYEKIKERNFDG